MCVCAAQHAYHARGNPQQGERAVWVTLTTDIHDGIDPTARHLLTPALTAAMRVQLAGKWKYASMTYREEHPRILPVEKAAPGCRPNSRLLPVTVAKEKMTMWAPWALAKVIAEAQALQAANMLQRLDIAQIDQVDAEPVAEVDVNEDI